MEWQCFTKVAERAKNLTKKLEEETDEIKETFESYWKLLQEELGTSEEWKDLNELNESLQQIQAELREVQKKAASEEILIKFAGATSSGKSSLINALLRSRRLPVGFMQTTMCSFKVCTTNEKEWSVTVKDENGKTVYQASSENEKYVRDLLSKMSGKEHANDREKMKIGTRTVVQVNWPKHLQREVLPLNVVLFDTPGLGEDDESDKVVTESCREADILVAVMDAMSPSKATVARLVNNVNCKFTFGVFTKWDECERKAKEKKKEDTVNVNQTGKVYEQDFLDALEGECKVFFVNVESENTKDAGFKEFKTYLQASATKLKGESLIEQAKSVSKKSIKVAEELKDIVDAKEKQKAASIKKEKDSMNKDEDSFNNLKCSLTDTEKLTGDAFNENTKRIEDFEKGVREGKPEDVVHNEFIDMVDKCTRDTLDRQRNEIRSAFTKWAENHNYDLELNKLVSDEIPQCETQGLTEEEYNWKWDPNVYYTNDYISAAVLVGGAIGGTIAGVAGVAGLAGMIAVESISTVAGIAGVGSAVGSTGGIGGTLIGWLSAGNLVRWLSPISKYRIRCWRGKLRDNLLQLYKRSKNLIFEDIKRIQDKAYEKLNHSQGKRMKKIQKEQKKSVDLSTWSKELKERRTRLTERNEEFDELRNELQTAEQESLSQQINAAVFP